MNSIEPYVQHDVVPGAAGELAPVRCKNCEAVLLGRYCVNCSQAADVHVPTTRELAHELLEGLTHSDSRLWRTVMTLWFKPGKLSEEFVAGRRVKYLPPFRLYLIVSIAFFLVASFMHSGFQVMNFDDALKPGGSPANVVPLGNKLITNCLDMEASGHPSWTLRLQHICDALNKDKGGDNLMHVAIGTMSKAMFVFLPLVALLHMLMYWWPRYRYAEHLLFFVHVHAFYFSVGILIVSFIQAAESWPSIAALAGFFVTVLGWTLPVYTVIAIRKVFPRSWIGALLKGVALFFVYMLVFALTIAAVFVYSLLQL
jgi:Protein of unknown function (DUF3667)